MQRYTELVNGEYAVTDGTMMEPVELLGVQPDGTCTRVLVQLASITGEPITKLGKYEDIHPDPEYVREIFERYMDLCR